VANIHTVNVSPDSFDPTPDFDDLLTVQDVARLLNVPASWVYEHTRSRGNSRVDRLPRIKLGKYVRFDPRAVRAFIARRSKNA
jgi:predicted DNA-binding transcriptional regulator AlpA